MLARQHKDISINKYMHVLYAGYRQQNWLRLKIYGEDNLFLFHCIDADEAGCGLPNETVHNQITGTKKPAIAGSFVLQCCASHLAASSRVAAIKRQQTSL
jgi:hypothetical protein